MITRFVFISSTQSKCEEWKECDMKKYLLFCVTFVTVQAKEKKLTTWKRTNWQVISTLPSLMIIKLGS